MAFPPLSEKERRYLLESYPLDAESLDRLLEDLWQLTQESPEAYALRRHRELQAGGLRNPQIYQTLKKELDRGRFALGTVSLRQVRRMIYG